jgi:putative acetyltransferase
MKLDTISSMVEAITLYRMLGFVETEPYRYNPMEDAVYLELRLC